MNWIAEVIYLLLDPGALPPADEYADDELERYKEQFPGVYYDVIYRRRLRTMALTLRWGALIVLFVAAVAVGAWIGR